MFIALHASYALTKAWLKAYSTPSLYKSDQKDREWECERGQTRIREKEPGFCTVVENTWIYTNT